MRLIKTAGMLGILACMMICQGCSGRSVPESHALTVDSNGVTGAGIKVGSSYADWIDAYGDYEIQQYDGENFIPFTPVEEDADAGSTDANSSGDAASADTTGDAAAAGETAGDASTSDTASAGTAAGHDGRYMVAAFYVDEEPISTDELCKTEGVEAVKLADHLASAEYLAEHKVLFRYIIFTITDDTVSDIEFDYLDYNTEL